MIGDGGHNRLCVCGCSEYVVQDENNTTRYHYSEACAWRMLQASELKRGALALAVDTTEEGN